RSESARAWRSHDGARRRGRARDSAAHGRRPRAPGGARRDRGLALSRGAGRRPERRRPAGRNTPAHAGEARFHASHRVFDRGSRRGRQRARRARPHAARLRARPLARAVRQAARERGRGGALARARRRRGRAAMSLRRRTAAAAVAACASHAALALSRETRTARAATAALTAASLAFARAGCGPSPEQTAAAHQATLDRYCAGCHDAAQREGDLVLTSAPLADPAAHADVFEKVVHKLSVGLMPPPGEPRPDAAATAALVGYLVDSLDAAAA